MPFSMDDFETWKIVMSVGIKYEVAPGTNHDFFNHLLTQYGGEFSQLEEWLDAQISAQFQAIDERPRWIQGPAWPYDDDGKPMIFVRQFEVSPENSGLHDYTGFYVFIPQEGWSDDEIRVVTQQY